MRRKIQRDADKVEMNRDDRQYCLVCGKQVVRQQGAGRPPKYCSVECRRSAADRMRLERAGLSDLKRKCRWCSKLITKDARRWYCSPDCSAAAVRQKLNDINEAKKTKRAKARKQFANCLVCKVLFKPSHASQIYCDKPKCKAVGQLRAIERQRQRREQAKLNRKPKVKPKKVAVL